MGSIVDAERLAREAKNALRQGDRAGAERMARESQKLMDGAGATNEKRTEVFHRLADIFRGLGDLSRCEIQSRAAIAAEEQCDRPALLGNHRMYYAIFLYEQRRFPEAATMAKAAVPCYERAFGPDHSQTLRVRVDAEQIVKAASE